MAVAHVIFDESEFRRCNKVSYDTRRAAVIALNAMRFSHGGLTIYRCRSCRAYHLGHKRG